MERARVIIAWLLMLSAVTALPASAQGGVTQDHTPVPAPGELVGDVFSADGPEEGSLERIGQPPSDQPSTMSVPSPAGCVGKSNNPHKDTLGRVKGVTEINCTQTVYWLRTTAQLWRSRWWGYEMVGTKGDNTNYSTFQVKASGIYTPCETNRWRTSGEHWSSESSGIYYRETMIHADVNC